MASRPLTNSVESRPQKKNNSEEGSDGLNLVSVPHFIFSEVRGQDFAVVHGGRHYRFSDYVSWPTALRLPARQDVKPGISLETSVPPT